MVYSRNWNEGLPLGSAAANTLETIIQNLKTDMRERLEGPAGEGPIPGWTDETEEPKIIVLHAGVAADRPATTDARTGEAYLATDTGVLSFFDGSDWVEHDSVSVIVDTFSNRPAIGSVSPGSLFWANDRAELYVAEASQWIETGASAVITVDLEANRPTIPSTPGLIYFSEDQGRVYIADDDPNWRILAPLRLVGEFDATATAGAQWSSVSNVRSLRFLDLFGTTDANGEIVIDLDEFGQNLQDPGTTSTKVEVVLMSFRVEGTVTDPYVCYLFVDAANNAVHLAFMRADTGSLIGSGIDFGIYLLLVETEG